MRRIGRRARQAAYGRLLTDWPVLPVLTHQRQTMRSLAAGRERAWPTFERPLFFGSSHVLMRRDAGTTHRACAAANAWSRGPLGEFSQDRSRVAGRIPELAVGASCGVTCAAELLPPVSTRRAICLARGPRLGGDTCR